MPKATLQRAEGAQPRPGPGLPSAPALRRTPRGRPRTRGWGPAASASVSFPRPSQNETRTRNARGSGGWTACPPPGAPSGEAQPQAERERETQLKGTAAPQGRALGHCRPQVRPWSWEPWVTPLAGTSHLGHPPEWERCWVCVWGGAIALSLLPRQPIGMRKTHGSWCYGRAPSGC